MKSFSQMLMPVTAAFAAVPTFVPSANSETQDSKLPQQSQLMRPSELPIYDDECGCKHNHGDILSAREQTSLEKSVAEIRMAIADVLNSFEGSKDRVVQFLEVGQAHTLDTVEYLREESNLLARIGAISAGGLTGLLLGVRGGAFKKLFYATIGTSAVASVCYPKAATQISKSGFTIAKYYAIVGYNKIQEEFSARKEAKAQTSNTPKVSSMEKIAEQKNVATVNAQIETQSQKLISNPVPVKVKGDYGQSNPEDRDMYTTRN